LVIFSVNHQQLQRRYQIQSVTVTGSPLLTNLAHLLQTSASLLFYRTATCIMIVWLVASSNTRTCYDLAR